MLALQATSECRRIPKLLIMLEWGVEQGPCKHRNCRNAEECFGNRISFAAGNTIALLWCERLSVMTVTCLLTHLRATEVMLPACQAPSQEQQTLCGHRALQHQR